MSRMEGRRRQFAVVETNATLNQGDGLPWRRTTGRKINHLQEFGAGNETRTRDPNLGKVVLYQLSYSRRTSPVF